MRNPKYHSITSTTTKQHAPCSPISGVGVGCTHPTYQCNPTSMDDILANSVWFSVQLLGLLPKNKMKLQTKLITLSHL